MTIWSNFLPAKCLPDNCDCEFVRDALIAQPSAFWSSFAYIILAFVLYGMVEKKTLTLKLWTMSFVLLGLCSLFAHASFIEFAMAMDFAGIILVLSFFFMIKFMIKWIATPWKITVLLLCYQGGLWMTFYSLDKWFKVSICVVIFLFAIVEILHAEGREFYKARELHWALVILFGSFGFFLFDELRISCDPFTWFQGHSIWHIGTATALFLYGKWRLRVSPPV